MQTDRHVGRDHLPDRLRPLEAIEQPVQLWTAHERGDLALGGLQVVGVGAAVAAHVHHKQVQQRTLGQVAVDALGLHIGGASDGCVFMEGLGGTRHQQGHILLLVATVIAQIFGVRIVVDHLVVVPLPDLRHIGGHAAHVGVHQVIAVPAPVLVQGFGHLAHLFGHHVVPHAAVGQLHLGADGAIRVDRVTAVQEKVGVGSAHLFVDLHAAPGLVDAPALSRGVAAPDKAHIAAGPSAHGRRRQAQMALHSFGQHALVVQVLQDHAVKNLLSGGQTAEVHSAGEVRAFKHVGAAHARGVGEAGGGRPVEPQTGRAVAAGPDHGAIGFGVTALDAKRHLGPHGIAGHHGGGRGLRPDAGSRGHHGPTHQSPLGQKKTSIHAKRSKRKCNSAAFLGLEMSGV